MALNWDKLSKLQRDHTKPKFAQQELARQLKKKPNDPYLLAWQVDLALRLGSSKLAEDTLNQILGRQTPITDINFLSYLYKQQVKRFLYYGETKQAPSSAGTSIINMWENAAKTMSTSKAKLELWSVLLSIATLEGCWEDVRVALNYVQKEGLKTSKNIAFAAIFASQMSFEMQKRDADQTDQPLSAQAKIGGDLALARMKLVFQTAAKSPSNPIRIEDFKDLRFMANIYDRQSKSTELFDLWDNAPDPVKGILDSNRHDITHLKVDILRKSRQWPPLLELCLNAIDRALAECDETKALTPLEYLAENGIFVFSALLEAVKNADADSAAAQDRLKDLVKRFDSKASQPQGRSLEIARLLLAAACKESLLERCKSLWLRYSHLDACYSDLGPYVQYFNAEERKDFLNFVTAGKESDISSLSLHGKSESKDRLQSQLNALTFRYLITISTREPPVADVLDTYIADAIQLCNDGSRNGHKVFYEAGFLVIHSLASHANRETYKSATPGVLGRNAEQSRMEYQAAIVSQRLKDSNEGKDQRRLVLYSARLHMLLGLSTLGFELYKHAKIKEMLTDTLSHHLLTGIAHTHPFETTSRPQVFPDEELAAVISKSEKMEQTLNDHLCSNNPKDYPYDSIVDMLDFKNALRSSLTKHLCVVQRRRIARLKGEQPAESLNLDLRTFIDISDQRDFFTLPDPENYELRVTAREESKLPPAGYPTIASLYHYYRRQDTTDRLVSGEKPHPTAEKRVALLTNEVKKFGDDGQGRLPSEKLLDGLWTFLESVAHHLNSADHAQGDPTKLHQAMKELLESLADAHKTFKDISGDITKPNSKTPHDSVFPRSDTLTYWYIVLEALQACRKASESAEGFFKPLTAKTIPAKAKNEAISTAKKIRETSDVCYKDVRKHVQEWIDFLNQHGMSVLKAWVRWGATGQALKEVLSDDDVGFYSRRALDSLLDTLSGVLKVKMGK